MAGELRIASSSLITVYARIMNSSAQIWNGSSFEAYNGSNYGNYDVAMTQQGTSGVFIGNFPTAITAAGDYTIFYHRQIGGSPAQGDPVVGTGVVVWNGSQAVIGAIPNAMTGSAFRDYVVRSFKRTDKDTEIYDAATDTIREIRRRLPLLEDEVEQQSTDAIATLGDYILSLEEDQGRKIFSIVVRDGDDSWPLVGLSKEEFDRRYPNPAASNVHKDKPVHYTIWANQIYLGHVPDSTSYQYWISYTADDMAAITSSTPAVPYSNLHREILKFGCLARLYADLKNNEEAAKWAGLYEDGVEEIRSRNAEIKHVVRHVRYRGV